MVLLRRRRKVQPTRSLLAAEAAQEDAAARRAVADRSGERLASVAASLGRHLEANNFGPRMEAALTMGPRDR